MNLRSCELLDQNNEHQYKRHLNSLVKQGSFEYRAHFFVGYTGTFTVGETTLSLENNFFTVTCPTEHYLVSVETRSEHSAYYLITFEIDKSDDDLGEYLAAELSGRKFLLSRTKRFLFDDIIRCSISTDLKQVKSGIHSLLALLYSLSSDRIQSGRVGRDELVDKATEYMRGQIHHNMHLNDVSDYLNISPAHFVRVFSSETGISPMKYFTRAKVEAAASVLRNTERTIESIAEQFHFCSAPHLSKIFKQYMGVPPKAYRNGHKATSEDRKKATLKELENAYELLHRIIDESPDFVFYKDINGIIMYCNNSFCRLLNMEYDQIVGKTDYDLFPKDEAEFYINNDLKIFRTKQPYRNKEWMAHPDGSRHNYEVYKAPFFDSEGKLLGLIGISRDITNR